MDIARWVGSTAIRLVTGALALACAGGIALHREQAFPEAGGWVLGLTIATGVLALMAAVHCSQGVYARWLAFSERLHTGVVTALFGACYLLLVLYFMMKGGYKAVHLDASGREVEVTHDATPEEAMTGGVPGPVR